MKSRLSKQDRLNESNNNNNNNDDGRNNQTKSGDGGSSDIAEEDEDEEVLISEDEMKKLRYAFRRLSRNTAKIWVEEAHIIVKQLTDNYLFAEQDIFDILEDEEVNQTRRLTEKNMIYLIQVIKKRQN